MQISKLIIKKIKVFCLVMRKEKDNIKTEKKGKKGKKFFNFK